MEITMQRTLAKSVPFSGTGLHSGARVDLIAHPASPGHGIVFQRGDLKHKPLIPGHASVSRPTPLSTTLITEDGDSIKTIEHLMSALAALNVDNALIAVQGPEIPLLDGSALPFFSAFKQAGVTAQNKKRRALKILDPIEVKDGDKFARLIPHKGRVFQMTIDFPHPLIGQQTFRFDLDNDTYESQVAAARTFGFMKDFDALRAAGLIKGGTLDNAVVFDTNGVVNPEGLRFADEPARHKLLDAIGDLSLAGAPIIGRYEGYKASHALNTLLVQSLLNDTRAWAEDTLETPSGRQENSRISAQREAFSKP